MIQHVNCKLTNTPAVKGAKLSLDMCPKTLEEKAYMAHVLYASVVGSLMCTMICMRPDISRAVDMVSQY